MKRRINGKDYDVTREGAFLTVRTRQNGGFCWILPNVDDATLALCVDALTPQRYGEGLAWEFMVDSADEAGISPAVSDVK